MCPRGGRGIGNAKKTAKNQPWLGGVCLTRPYTCIHNARTVNILRLIDRSEILEKASVLSWHSSSSVQLLVIYCGLTALTVKSLKTAGEIYEGREILRDLLKCRRSLAIFTSHTLYRQRLILGPSCRRNRYVLVEILARKGSCERGKCILFRNRLFT